MTFSRLIKTRLKELNNCNQTFADLFQLIHDQNGKVFCEQISDRIFVQKISYWEIKRLSLNVANKLKNQYHYERIGIKMRNSYLFIVMFWGIILSGNIPVLINIELTDAQIDKVISDLKIKDVIDYERAKEIYKEIAYKLPSVEYDYKIATNEIILMSMGTTGNLHYCSYSGSQIAAFINKTPYIVKRIPQMLSKKNIKHIALLPLYHIFGLFTVYFWFSFFGMSFLFVEDILNDPLGNIRRYKVTHIFAVPAFFKIVAEGIVKEVKRQNMLDEFNEGLEKSFAIQSKFPKLNRYFIRRKFEAIIRKTFGFEIALLISGGASLDEETLRIFNSIGYDLITGYGTTEVGITSINLSNNITGRIKSNIGTPLPNVEYRINDKGILEIKADTQANNILDFFVTNDFCVLEDSNYRFVARNDEIVVLSDGENYNLNYLQSLNYHFEIINQYSFIPYKNNIVLVFSIHKMSQESIILAKHEVRNNDILKNNKITKIMFTESALRSGLKMINYREVLASIESGAISVHNLSELDEVSNGKINELDLTALHVERIIMNVLNITSPIGYDVDIFLELGCTSFDYALIVNDINEHFQLANKIDLSELFQTVQRSINQFVEVINKSKEE